jgi:hypothetical protein
VADVSDIAATHPGGETPGSSGRPALVPIDPFPRPTPGLPWMRHAGT